MTAMQDPALRGAPREIYLWLHERLDVVEFRAVKVAEIETGLAMRKTTVREAVALLVHLTYVDRGTREGRIWTYRLFYSCPLRVPKAPQKSA